MEKVNLILSGGFGTRLWPISQPDQPKQFLPFFPDRTLFQHCLDRNSPLVDRIAVVTNENHAKLAEPILKDNSKKPWELFLEPAARNSAAAIAWACASLKPETLVIVTPSDHIIRNESQYQASIKRAFELAEHDFIVTLGIEANSPETGFGYIESDGEDVLSFKEKPDAVTAQAYLDAGNYYWNGGIFIFKAKVFLDELSRFEPELFSQIKELTNENLAQNYPLVKDISVDYAVMERSHKLKVVKGDLGWSDLGCMEAFFDYFAEEELQHAYLKGRYTWSDLPGEGTASTNQMLVIANGYFIQVPYGDGQQIKSIMKKFT